VGDIQRGRRIALLQDTYDSPQAVDLCRDVDILIHECTYEHSFEEKAIEHGHSTSAMAGAFAHRVCLCWVGCMMINNNNGMMNDAMQ
jgi:ribonuclease Z